MRVAITTIVAATAFTALGISEAAATAPPDGTNWTGFYGGIHLGADSTRAKSTGSHFDGGEGFFCCGSNPASFSTRHAPTQFQAGGQAGFNYQMGNFILGVEGDASWIGGGRGVQSFDGAEGQADSVTSKVDGLYTIRGRAGFLYNDIYLFATGGAAFSNIRFRFMSEEGLTSTMHLSDGWTVGGGAETFLWPNLSLSVTGLYVDLGSKSMDSTDAFDEVTWRATAKQFIWSLALNYHL
jgi:outer membrane immunogenic protein